MSSPIVGGTRVVTSNQSESLISYEGNNRIVRPRFSLNGESKGGRCAVHTGYALRFLYRRFFFFFSSLFSNRPYTSGIRYGLDQPRRYKNVVRIPFFYDTEKKKEKKDHSLSYAYRGKNNAIRLAEG